MDLDLHTKAQQLLETLANSIMDREPKIIPPFFFNAHDRETAEIWLEHFLRDFIKNHIDV